MRYLLVFVAAAFLAAAAGESRADRVHTRNGTWEGSVVRETPTQIDLETADGSIITIPRANIRKIECTAEEDAVIVLSEIAAAEEKAERARGRRELKDALDLYLGIAEKAAGVRERAGALHDEALEAKSRAESIAEELREAIRQKDIFMADEAGPEDLLREKGIAFDAPAFIEAAGRGDAEIIALFLEAGMDADARCESGKTALMKACGGGCVETAGKLIAAGAEVGLRDEAGYTALHYAMRNGDTALVQMIVDATH